MGNEYLSRNQYLVDPSQTFELLLDYNCNLAVYNYAHSYYDNPYWQTGTRADNCFLMMQLDCNLVLYDGYGRAIWNSDTDSDNGNRPCYFTMQSDRNIVVYSQDTREALWSAGIWLGRDDDD